MVINIRKIIPFVNVDIATHNTTIDLGLLDEEEGRELVTTLINAASEIEHSFNGDSELNDALNEAIDISGG